MLKEFFGGKEVKKNEPKNELGDAIEKELGGVEIPPEVAAKGHEAVLEYLKEMEERSDKKGE